MNGVWELPEARAKAPYPGLRPFGANERSIFFGREQMIEEVLMRLNEQQMVIVHGTSGCGKSSLIAAGVLPQLARERARRGRALRVGTFRPGEKPATALTETLMTLLGTPGEPVARHDIHDALDGDDPRGRLARLAGKAGIDQLCIVIDQFEELFRVTRTAGENEDEAGDFARLLVRLCAGYQPEKPWWEVGTAPPAGKAPTAAISFIVTMRSEFLGECSRYRGLAEAMNLTQYLLPNMDRADLIRAIREPAELFGCKVDHALAERMADDASKEKDSLPLVQHALMLMWRSADRPTVLNLTDYEGALTDSEQRLEVRRRTPLGAILAGHAEKVWLELTEGHYYMPQAAQFIFRALTKTDPQGRGVRTPQNFETLRAIGCVGDDGTRRIIDEFRQEGVSFLTPYEGEKIYDFTPIDISHEALIRTWPRMTDERLDDEGNARGWIQREAQDGHVWRWLAVQANLAQSQGGARLKGAALDRVERWWDRIKPRPEWARRHLIRPEGTSPVAESREWQEVSHLIDRSRAAAHRLALLYRIGTWAFVVVAIVTAVLAIQNYRGWETQKATTEEVATKGQTAERQLNNRVTALNKRLVAAIEAEGPAVTTERVSDQVAEAATRPISEGEIIYLWGGTQDGTQGGVINLADMEGRIVRVQDVRPYTRYKLVGNTVVREGFPADAGWARTRAILRRGTVLLVLAVRQVPVNGRREYWVQAQRVGASIATVRLHVPEDTGRLPSGRWATIRNNLRADLNRAGYNVTRVTSPLAVDRLHSLYCRPEDQGRATHLANTVTRWLSNYHPELGELVVLAIPGGGNCPAARPGEILLMIDFSPRQPGQPPPQPVQAPAAAPS